MIYKFRAILDNEDDVFRDIAIEAKDTLEDLHNALVNAFGFDGTEVGAFYTCGDDWAWHEEDGIPMFDTGDIPGEIKTMAEYKLDDLVHEQNTKLVYVYDLFSMWTFFVELAAIEESKEEVIYPALLFSHGLLPDEATTSGFRDTDFNEENFNDDFEDDFNEEDFDSLDNHEDFGFEENWN